MAHSFILLERYARNRKGGGNRKRGALQCRTRAGLPEEARVDKPVQCVRCHDRDRNFRAHTEYPLLRQLSPFEERINIRPNVVISHLKLCIVGEANVKCATQERLAQASLEGQNVTDPDVSVSLLRVNLIKGSGR